MKVLFSPIGNTDPWRNNRDGSMLNIVRTYLPDVVELFFTESIWEGNSKIPGQKLYDWEKIIKSVSPHAEVRIKIDKIDNPHDFDAFKDIFHMYLNDLDREFPEHQILLNVTSGTPQMEATLCLEYVTYPKNKECIQVSTPVQSSNVGTKHANPEYQEVDLTIVNEEEEKCESRCKEINIISFRNTMLRLQLKELIHHYDYEGALALLNTIPKGFRNKKKLIKEITKISDNIKLHEPFEIIKEKYKRIDTQKALFHILLLNMRYSRGDIAETLIRLKSLSEFILEKYIDEKYKGMIIYEDGKPRLNISYDIEFIEKYKLQLEKAKKELKSSNILGFPAYRDFLTILEPDGDVIKEAHFINQINGLRNKVAHNLDSLNLYHNKNERKIDDAVKAVQNLLLLVFYDIQKEDLNLLKNFNESLKEKI